VAVYTVRGRVASVPDPSKPASEFRVHHEPIPSFKSGGEVVGMNAMVMPFEPLAEGVSLEDIEPGDIVELSFEVVYDPVDLRVRGYTTIAVRELPADTALNLGAVHDEGLGEDADR